MLLLFGEIKKYILMTIITVTYDDDDGSFVTACCFKIEIYCCKTAPNKESCSQTRKNDRLTQLSQHWNFVAQGCFWAPT